MSCKSLQVTIVKSGKAMHYIADRSSRVIELCGKNIMGYDAVRGKVAPGCPRRLSSLVLCAVFAAIALLSSPAFSQTTGSINGTVVDKTGAAVPNATLTLTDLGTNRVLTITSSGQGYFNFANLPPAEYRLKASASGFKEFINSSLRLTVGQQMSLQVPLIVGGVTQSVVVTGAPPPVTTTSASVGQLIDTQQIQNLPLNGRNALSLVLLVPGTLSAGTTGQFGATQEQFTLSGSNSNFNNFSLDGAFNMNAFYGNATDYPNPDALQEFKVTTRDYSATLGRGFNSISAVTKSGSNTIHGTAFEFIRNTVLDASNYFATAPSPFKRNQFGGTLGGKVIKDKLFYFGSYQGTQVRGTPGILTYLPLSAEQRTGDFSELPTPIIDPTTGKQFPNNQIPANRIVPFASEFIEQFLPLPNSGQYYSFAPATSESANQVITKVDYLLTPKDHLSARYLFDNIPQLGNGVSSFLDSSWVAELPTRNQSIVLNYSRIFSPTILNKATWDYDRSAYGVINRKNFSFTDLGLDVNSENALNEFGLTPDSVLCLDGYFCAEAGVPTRDIVPTTHFNDTLSIQRGSQSISVGVEIYHTRVNQLQNFLTDGDMSFSGFATGDAAADFLLGDFASYEQITPLITRLRQTLPSLFAQDNIRVSRNITVNAGIRWDIYHPWISENNVLGTYIPGKQSTVFPLMPPGLLYPGDPGIPRGVASSRYNNIAPRLGVNWDVRGDGRLSVRAGAGIFYMTSNDAINFNRFPQMTPFGFEATLNGGNVENLWAAAPYNGVNPFPRPDVTDVAGLKKVPFIPTTAFTSLQLPFKTPAEDQWSLSVQQAIGRDSVFEVAYVGSAVSHDLSSYEGNPAVYIPGNSTIANTQERRLNPEIGPINVLSTYLSSNYHALQVSFNRNFSNGLSISSAYTWSKALGVVAGLGEGSEGQRDPFDKHLDYGVSNTNIASNWVSSVVWDIPFAKHMQPRVLRAILNGWQLNGINTLHSGGPFTINSGLDNSFSGIGGDTADLVGNPNLPSGRSRVQKLDEWFNTSAFAVNAVGTFGDTGINSWRGPGYWDLDLGAIKRFRLTERVNLEFRSLFYNAPNHPNFDGPNGTVTSPGFGSITGAGDPRVIEFASRLEF